MENHDKLKKPLTHKHQVLLRKERFLELCQMERKKKELANSKHQERIDANRKAVSLLCKELEKEGMLADGECGTANEEYLERCSLAMIGTLTCPELDAFIMAPQDPEVPQFTAKSKIPKKGHGGRGQR